jgi:xylulokinase
MEESMDYIISFDIGTTEIKGIMVNQHGEILLEGSTPLKMIYGENGEKEQNPESWWEGVIEIAACWKREESINLYDVKAITLSGQMENVIPISYNNKCERAILYSDTRAKEEAEYINHFYKNIGEVIGNHVRSSTPFAKLLWLKNKDIEAYYGAQSFVFSAKDYIIYKLTSRFVTDPITGATTGMMNLNKRIWEEDIIVPVGIDIEKLPEILQSEEKAGRLSANAAEIIGLQEGIPVLCGSGDAGASTIGAGAVVEGQGYLHLGTTGWVAIPAKRFISHPSAFTLAHLPKHLLIAVIPLLNGGNIYQWGVQTFTDNEDYEGFERMVKESLSKKDDVLFLPYLYGERDREEGGAFISITAKTTKEDFTRAIVEGLCYSIKQICDELLSPKEGDITIIGGTSRSTVLCQCLADVLGRQINVPKNSHVLTAYGALAPAFIALGWSQSYNHFVRDYINKKKHVHFKTDVSKREYHIEQYKRYIKYVERK